MGDSTVNSIKKQLLKYKKTYCSVEINTHSFELSFSDILIQTKSQSSVVWCENVQIVQIGSFLNNTFIWQQYRRQHQTSRRITDQNDPTLSGVSPVTTEGLCWA